MPENGNDIFLCHFDKNAAHLCQVSRLPSQFIIKSYQRFTFDKQIKRSDFKSSSVFYREFSQAITDAVKTSSLDNVFITIPSNFGYIDSFRKEPHLNSSGNRDLGLFLLQNATRIKTDKLNFDIVQKDQSENWLFAIEKKLALEIKNLFKEAGLKTSSIMLNAIVLENYLESASSNETKVLLDFSPDFVEIWILNNSKLVASWQLIPRNDLIGKEKKSIAAKIDDYFSNIQSHYSIKIDEIFYSGLLEKNDINQLFQSDRQFNLKEATIDRIGSIDPQIEGLSQLGSSSSILVKIAGTTLSIN